jgi:hypothetical protein
MTKKTKVRHPLLIAAFQDVIQELISLLPQLTVDCLLLTADMVYSTEISCKL